MDLLDSDSSSEPILKWFSSKEDEKREHKNEINMQEWVKHSCYLEGSWAK